MEIDKRDRHPDKINHSFHSHTLTLGQGSYSFYCDSCHKFFGHVPRYRCTECKFYLDVECALMEPIRCEGQEHIQHFSHQHPMPLVQIDPQHHIQCFACQSLCSGPAYACKKCEYFLHKSCAELPHLIHYPAHSFHPLFLRVKNCWSFTCNICSNCIYDQFIYDCKQCNNGFPICVKCYHGPSIKYRYHEHLFFFFEDGNYRDLAQCNAFDNYCHQPKASTDLHYTTNSYFHCANCDFKIHFLCGPLPSTIKHECHMHPLNLVDSVVEANSDEYYCDVCEIKRNPRIRVYYCKECQYIAHPHCVISEIVKVFNGDLGGVTLKLIGQDFWEQPQEDWDLSSSFTLLDLLSSNELAGYEKERLSDWFKWDKSSKGEEDSKVEVADEDIDEIITRYPFFNQQEDLASFLFDDLDRNMPLLIKSSDLSLKIVHVQGYSIPVTLAPVLQTLLHKYPHIISSAWPFYGCTTPAMENICFFFLCKVLNSMHTTRFADITKNLLWDWCYYLAFVNVVGKFSIDFVEQHLEMMIRAFVGVQLARLETEIPTKLNNKIGKLQQEMDKLQQEITGLKDKVEICNKRFESSSNLEFMKDNLRIGAELKWKTAGQVWF